MPINTDSMLLRLSPLAPINLGGLGGGSGLERERLQLMRQQFEEQKRQNREQAELRRLGESNEMARANLLHQQAQQKLEAEKAAELQKNKLAAELKFSEMAGAGDVEGMRSFVPYLRSVRKGAELLGEEGGMPAYRLYELDEQGNEIVPEADQLAAAAGAGPAPRPSDEVYGATEESPTESLGRLNAVLGAQDDTGDGTPSNVIDMGAMQASTMQRLAPALGSLVQAYPEQYRESAMETAKGVAGMGMPGIKSLEQFKSLRSSPDSLITSLNESAAQQGRFEQTQQAARSKEGQNRYDTGFGSMGKEMAAKYNVEDLISARDQTRSAIDILTNPDPTDDQTVLALVSRRLGERGATTEGDVKRVTGQSSMSWVKQIETWIEKGLEGGLSRTQRDSLVGILKLMEASDAQRFNTFQDRVDELVNDPSTDRDVARGLSDYARVVVPSDIRAARKPKTADATTGASPIPDTARIAQAHNNPGNLKFADQDGATKGEAAGDGGNWAKFSTYEDGLAALKSQVEKDAKRGLTVEQFVTKYAPPGSNDTAKYIADAVKSLGATAGQKLSEFDIDKIVAFVAKKESGTEVDAPAADTAKPSRARELLLKGGY